MSTSFLSLGVRADIAARLNELGISEPFPIQSSVLPDGLAGRDLFAQSPTGSGKTLAFAIPLISRIGKASPRRPRGLVLAPTRELAAQIAEAIRPLAKTVGRSVASFYGGTGYKEQLGALQRGVDIVVGCPGRLIDLRDRGALSLSEVEVVVVDEADRMADMGFLPAVRSLLAEVRGTRQTMLFSATLTREVERLVRDYQKSPKRHVLELASDDIGSRTHEFWRSSREERAGLVTKLVASHESSIVFCRTKHGADRLTRQLAKSGVSSVAIHGDRSQPQRDRALARFRDRQVRVLVGTDVASRGLHVDGVDCVVHFDPPEDVDTYVHRSGRTGRAGAAGRVVSLVSADQERTARKLQQTLGIATHISSPPAMADVVITHQDLSDGRDDQRGTQRSDHSRSRTQRPPRNSGPSGSGAPRSRQSGRRKGQPRTSQSSSRAFANPARSRARRAS